MTNEIFWNLYNNGEIDIKLYSGIVNGVQKEIDAFTYQNKYYLRIIMENKYTLDRTAECGKKLRMKNHYCTIKEFTTKEQANNYFKKAAKGLLKIK